MNKDSNNGARTPLEELHDSLAVVRDRVRGVALGDCNGFYFVGRAGTSKTHCVLTTLEQLRRPFHYHKGHLTPGGLLDLLKENCDRVLVLDDVAALFKDRVALQYLMAALGNGPDSTGVRDVRYKRQGREEVIHFTGGIIIVSNLDVQHSPLGQALKSRVHYLQHDPTDEQIEALMRAIAAQGWPRENPVLTPEECLEVCEYLIQQSRKRNVRLDLRYLVDKAFPDYAQWVRKETEANWRDLIDSTLEDRAKVLRRGSRKVRLPKENIEAEQKIVLRIWTQFPQHPAKGASRGLAGSDAGQEERACAVSPRQRTRPSERGTARRRRGGGGSCSGIALAFLSKRQNVNGPPRPAGIDVLTPPCQILSASGRHKWTSEQLARAVQ